MVPQALIEANIEWFKWRLSQKNDPAKERWLKDGLTDHQGFYADSYGSQAPKESASKEELIAMLEAAIQEIDETAEDK